MSSTLVGASTAANLAVSSVPACAAADAASIFTNSSNGELLIVFVC
jgi:hypothetical protein